MLWLDWPILIALGAFIGGAYAFGIHPERGVTLSQPGADGASSDTTYITTRRTYVLQMVGVAVVAAALYLGFIWHLGGLLRSTGAVATLLLLAVLVAARFPHTLNGSLGMPRGYADHAAVVAIWKTVSMAGGVAGAIAAMTLLSLSVLRISRMVRDRV